MLAILQRITDLVAPPVCVLCGGDGQRLDELWGLDLCAWCEQACTPVADPCQRCGESGCGSGTCASCQAAPPSYDAAFCLFRYEEPVDLLVTALKFRHELAAARVLGTLFARRCIESGRRLPDCLVPVPLHASRLRERGFNQAAEIARHLAPRLHRLAPRLHHIAPRLRQQAAPPVPVRTDLLQRQRATHAQSELAAGERAANLAGAFRVRKGRRPPAHIALLDDVMTTGHTAAAAALALKEAGCKRVEIWACARALREEGPRPAGGVATHRQGPYRQGPRPPGPQSLIC